MKQSKSKLKKILITLFICIVVVGAVHETDPNYNDKAETTVATTKQTTKFVAKNIENVSTQNIKAKVRIKVAKAKVVRIKHHLIKRV